MATLKSEKRSGKTAYVVRWRDGGHAQRERSFTRKVDAETFLHAVEHEKRQDRLDGVVRRQDAGKVLLRAYAEDWRARQTYDSTGTPAVVERKLRLHVYPHLGDRELRSIRPADVQAWLVALKHLAPATLKACYVTLSAVLADAVANGEIRSNPARDDTVKVPRAEAPKVEVWPVETVRTILAALTDRYRLAGTLAAGCGLRQGEVFGLSPDDVVTSVRGGQVLTVRRQVALVDGRRVFAPPKGGKERQVPVSDVVVEELREHLAQWPAVPVTLPWQQPDGERLTVPLLIVNKLGTAFVRSGFDEHQWHPAIRAAGIEPGGAGTGMHQLRHHFASVLLDAGESVKATSEYLGHHSAAFTLATYAHVMPTSDERTRKAIDAALRPAQVSIKSAEVSNTASDSYAG